MTRNTKDQTLRGRLRQIFLFSWRDCAVCVGILAAAALLCALLRMIDSSDVYVALIFECAVVLVSRFTDGYLFGLLASVIGVVGVNWIFTYPYMQLNFTISGYPLTFLVMLAVSVVACAGFNYVECDHSQVKTSDAGLPMVATDFLGQDDARRVLALRADSAESVSYSVMRTGRGDLIDSSPARRVEVVSGRSDGSSRTIAQDCAQLLANADSDAINELGKLGFGGIYVIKQNGDKAQREASNQLNSNIGASDGTQNVVSLDNGTYYRLTVQDLSKQHIDRSGLDKAGSSVWRRSWLWCMGVVLVAYCLVALPRIRRQGLEEA